MTLRHPKSIVLAGNRWTVEYDKSSQSGEYTTSNHSIIIGTRGTDERTLAIILHELAEIQISHLHCRYTDDYIQVGDCVSFLFVMTHPQFQEALELITPVLMEFLPRETSKKKEVRGEQGTAQGDGASAEEGRGEEAHRGEREEAEEATLT